MGCKRSEVQILSPRQKRLPHRSLFLFLAYGVRAAEVRKDPRKATQNCMYLRFSDTCNFLSQCSLLAASIQPSENLSPLQSGKKYDELQINNSVCHWRALHVFNKLASVCMVIWLGR